MKKYEFSDGYKITCEGLDATDISKIEASHGKLLGVMISKVGYVRSLDKKEEEK